MYYANYGSDYNHYILPIIYLPEDLSMHVSHVVHSCSSARAISPSQPDLNIHFIGYVNFCSSVEVSILTAYAIVNVQYSSVGVLITVQHDLVIRFFVYVNSVSLVVSNNNNHTFVHVYYSPSCTVSPVPLRTYINDVSLCVNFSGSYASEPSTCLYVHLPYE